LLFFLSIFRILSRGPSSSLELLLPSEPVALACILAAIRPLGRTTSSSSSESVSDFLDGEASVSASLPWSVASLCLTIAPFAIEVINRVRGDPQTLSSSESLSRAARRALTFDFGVNCAGDAVPDTLAGEDSRDGAIENVLLNERILQIVQTGPKVIYRDYMGQQSMFCIDVNQ
jgi:hypothetical protein